MTLAYVQLAVAAFMGLIITLTGLLTSIAVLLPVHTQKAEAALEKSRVNCFLGGLGMVVLAIIGIILASLPPPPVKIVGLSLLLVLGGIATLGGAGIAQLMGKRISEMSGAKTSFGALVRGSAAYSVGVFFPLIGWYLFAPLSLLCALGAGLASLWPTPNEDTRRVATPWYPQQPGMPAFAASVPVSHMSATNAAAISPQMDYSAPAIGNPTSVPSVEDKRTE